jgi:hypothetical protein
MGGFFKIAIKINTVNIGDIARNKFNIFSNDIICDFLCLSLIELLVLR